MAATILGPPDGGWGWVCVVGRLYGYFCAMGTASSFGIIYIELIDYFNTTREETAWIGSLSFGLSLLIAPVSNAATTRFGIQKTTAAGALIAFSGCFISWFATGLPYLYVSYGVMMGIGCGLILVPCTVIVVHYFKARLGIANGIGSVGEGLGTLVLPPLYTYLIEEYGWRGTLLLLSGLILNCLVCAVIFIPPPHLKPNSETSSSCKSYCKSCLPSVREPVLILYISGAGLAHLGYVIPFIHLPDMAIQIGIEKYDAAYLLSIMGVSNIVGRVVFGWISDFPCVNVMLLQGVSAILCSVATAICPHFTDFYAFAVYAVIYGTFLASFSSLLPVGSVVLAGPERTGDVLAVIFCLAGIMITAASPLAGWLFDITGTYDVSFYVAASPLLLGGVISIIIVVLQTKKKKTKNIETVKSVIETHEQDIRLLSKPI